jgi:hypothetical protein
MRIFLDLIRSAMVIRIEHLRCHYSGTQSVDARDTLEKHSRKIANRGAINYRDDTACLFSSIGEETVLPGKAPLGWKRPACKSYSD